MEKAGKGLMALLLIFSFVCGDFFTPKAQAKATQTATVNASSLHIRNKDSLKGKIIGYVKKGKKVQVLKTETKWTYIKYGATKGWVSAKYLSKPKNTPAKKTAAFASYNGYVTTSTLYVRQSPAGKISGTLKKNAAVKVTGKTSKNNTVWLKIKYGSKSGYVSEKYIKKGSPPKAAPKKTAKPKPAPTKPAAAKTTAKSQPKTKPAAAFASYSGYVTADTLNVRQSPAGKVSGTLKKNTAVKVTGKTSKNNTAWLKIKYGSKSGYVSGKYIKKGSPPKAAPKKTAKPKPAPTKPAAPKTTADPQPKTKPAAAAPVFASYGGYVTADALNVRQSPAGEVIDSLKKNKAVTVTGKTSKNDVSWLKVNYDKKSGYVSGKYIQKGAAPKTVNKTEPPVNSSSKKGIDISHINGAINFNSVKKDGYSFVIAKATEGQTFTDVNFKHNIQSAKAVGLQTHAYHFFRAESVNTAKKEADHFAAVLKSADFDGDAFIDVETTNGVSRAALTNNVNAFLEQLKHDGYSKLGIYSGVSFYQDHLDASKLPDNLILWLARYRYEETYLGLGQSADIWQYTDKGTVDGISGSVDIDVSYSNDF